MRKITKLLFSFGLLLTLPTAAKAYTVTVSVDQLKYTVDTDSGEAELYGPISNATQIVDLTIPESVEFYGKEYPVTSIRSYAFSGSDISGSLTIGNSVKTIGKSAFEQCSGFTGSLTIPNSVTTIGDNAFKDCRGFNGSLTIGNSVQTIGDYAFRFCSGLTGSLIIPGSVTSIGRLAFYYCSGFTGSLTIPNSVTSIGVSAFYKCSGLNGSLTIPNTLTTIENYTFAGCSGLTGSIRIPDSVTSIGEHAFEDCSGFTGSLIIPNSVTTIGLAAFEDCSGISGSVVIGSSVTSIGNAAFEGCSQVESLYLPASLEEIGWWAFFKCEKLTLVECNAKVPPTCVESGVPMASGTDDPFEDTPKSELRVPAESIELYKEAKYWRGFKNINPVKQIEVSDIKLDKSSATINIGETVTLTATVEPENAMDKSVVWTSSNEKVASVTNGVVTGLTAGKATITATTANGLKATCEVTVKPEVARPETPRKLERKGDGSSCTFVVMMNLSNEALAEEGYEFVYGYTDYAGRDNVIANTSLRYCHTSAQIYNDSNNDFWVFAYKVENGETVNSDRKHLDGRVDAGFDGTQLIYDSRSSRSDAVNPDNWIKATAKGVTINIESDEASTLNIYTLNGMLVRSQAFEAGVMVNEEIDRSSLASGIYVVTVKSGPDSSSKKVVIK